MNKFFRLTATQSKIELVKVKKLKSGFSLNFAPPSVGMAINDYAKKLIHEGLQSTWKTTEKTN